MAVSSHAREGQEGEIMPCKSMMLLIIGVIRMPLVPRKACCHTSTVPTVGWHAPACKYVSAVTVCRNLPP